MNKKPSEKDTPLSGSKKLVFTILTYCIPVFLFLFIELILRLFHYGGDTRLFVSGTDEISDYYRINHEVGNRYFFMQNTVPDPSKDLFLKNKPENGFRIFVMGGSTTAGFPYGNNALFSRILHQRLNDTYPYHHIEVVNVAMAAVNSYTLLDLLDEILEQKPDMILIYAGHNEYYGALGVASNEYMGKMRGVIKSYLKLNNIKSFILLRDVAARIGKSMKRAAAKNAEPDPTATLMARIVGDPSILFGGETYRAGKKQFENNLIEIVKKIKKHDIPVVLSELISNVKQPPFQSISNDTLPPAMEVFQRAHDAEKKGYHQKANELYCWAKDLDALRFRAPEEFNQIIHHVADLYHIPVVPMQTYFSHNSRNGIIGYDLILEHLHPNVRGYFTMADAFYDMICDKEYVSGTINGTNIKSTSEYLDDWGITRLDTLVESVTLMYLMGGWPFTDNKGPNKGLAGYHPATKAESLAVKILTNDQYGIEMGHLDLAEYYESIQMDQKAFNEYKALIYTVPYEDLFVKRAVKILIQAQAYDRALEILFLSKKYKDSGFVNKRVGQILLLKKRTYEAQHYFERAVKLLPDDSQLIVNLCQAYIAGFQYQKANQLIKRYQHNTIDQKQVHYLRALERETRQSFSEVNTLIKDARKQIEKGQSDRAIRSLTQSIKLIETPAAYFWLGQLYMQRGDLDASLTVFHKGLKLSPYDFNLLYALLYIAVKHNQKKEAVEIFKKLNYYYPGFKDPSNLRDHFQKK